MNVWVVYESILGNTSEFSRMLASHLSVRARVRLVQASRAGIPHQVDLIITGCPSHRNRKPGALFDWLGALPPGALQGTWIAAFEIRFVPVHWRWRAPVQRLMRKMMRLGGYSAGSVESFYLAGPEGPLAEGELDRGLKWSESLLRTCSQERPLIAQEKAKFL